MAKPAAVSPLLAVILVAAVMVAVAKGQSPSECKAEKDKLVKECKAVVLLRVKPSAKCCEQIRVSRVQCVCPYITPKVASLFTDVRRIVNLIESCGRTVPRNFKCGSITTPP